MNIEFEKLAADFLVNYRDKIESVTITDLNKVAGKYLNKAKNVVLILGDSSKFDKTPTTDKYIFITPEE
jgi:predicted Zn-dependent peptidase